MPSMIVQCFICFDIEFVSSSSDQTHESLAMKPMAAVLEPAVSMQCYLQDTVTTDSTSPPAVAAGVTA
jgi:hypothetical protein